MVILDGVIWSAKVNIKPLVAKGTKQNFFYNFIVITVSADVLAPLGARVSAGTMMASLGPVYMWDWHWQD